MRKKCKECIQKKRLHGKSAPQRRKVPASLVNLLMGIVASSIAYGIMFLVSNLLTL